MKCMQMMRWVGIYSIMVSTGAQAAMDLGLVKNPGAPDFASAYIDVNYSASSGTFTASGYTTDYANGSVGLSDVGNWSLTAQLNSTYQLVSGNVTVRGNIGNGDELLLSGSLITGAAGSAYGWSSDNSQLQFKFNVDGGNTAVRADFHDDLGGIWLYPKSAGTDIPFIGDWSKDFNDSTWNAVADTFVPVPESSTYPLFGLGILVLAVVTSRFKSNARAAA